MSMTMNGTGDDHAHGIHEILDETFPVVFTVLGAAFNLLSICGILGFKPLRQWKNTFTFNLSLSDFIASLGILINYVPRLPGKLHHQEWSDPMFTTGLIMSILSTLAIAVHRFIIVRFDPLGNRNIVTGCRAVFVVVLGWVVVSAVYAISFHLEGDDDDPAVSRIGSTVAIWVCMVITLLCYGFIYCRIACASWYSARLEGLTQRGIGVHKRILFTFSLVIGSTFLCWIPISLVLLLEGLGLLQDKEWVSIFSDVAFNLLCLNQVINPIIYWTRLTDFRDQLCCCPRRRIAEDEQGMMVTVPPDDLNETDRFVGSGAQDEP